ncbi:hypothetical protein HF325_000112 [Metschnikowia pulcherrima]|uniref:Uncharacterized protein n=1 Tax=Metschnikowia pulcherrima TaxID=27326 RepID=A0A8H7GVQ3_9ASCO|nr:hypothetical protein HF325_000112 [Metschnikowia pulcherrima]
MRIISALVATALSTAAVSAYPGVSGSEPMVRTDSALLVQLAPTAVHGSADKIHKREDAPSVESKNEMSLVVSLILLQAQAPSFDWKYFLETLKGLYEWFIRKTAESVPKQQQTPEFKSSIAVAKEILYDMFQSATHMQALEHDESPGAAELYKAWDLNVRRWRLHGLLPKSEFTSDQIDQTTRLYNECYDAYNSFVALEDRSKQGSFEPLIQKIFGSIKPLREAVTHQVESQTGVSRWA